MATDETARLTADVLVLAENHVLLVRRRWDPFADRWALPGGHVDAGEEVTAAGQRELAEETGVSEVPLDLVGVYSTPGRDPRGRYVTWAFVALLPERVEPTAGSDAREVRWWPLAEVLATPHLLAFDHHPILTDTLAHVRTRALTC
ncbi:NUDIX hydrolase [Kutzneria viridogrisea]|uniref:8-oxo-dGTP diphosphatase n=1 Tax=Kutzneria viridogrisea TaxID=47990 RepID=A0ABR6C001_9PSEU|nr:8-oxo-dGTP diphosphatase [Kutzneria viridogrisea]